MKREIRLGDASVLLMMNELSDIVTKLNGGYTAEHIPTALAEIGASAAESAYGFPVTTETEGDTATITASHEGLSFMEFGAGMTVNDANPYVSEVDYPVYQGSYSDAHHGMYAATGYQYWIFKHQLYDRVVPRGGMMAAGQAIRDNIKDVVEGVIGID